MRAPIKITAENSGKPASSHPGGRAMLPAAERAWQAPPWPRQNEPNEALPKQPIMPRRWARAIRKRRCGDKLPASLGSTPPRASQRWPCRAAASCVLPPLPPFASTKPTSRPTKASAAPIAPTPAARAVQRWAIARFGGMVSWVAWRSCGPARPCVAWPIVAISARARAPCTRSVVCAMSVVMCLVMAAAMGRSARCSRMPATP